jgi:hypothetical protein
MLSLTGPAGVARDGLVGVVLGTVGADAERLDEVGFDGVVVPESSEQAAARAAVTASTVTARVVRESVVIAWGNSWSLLRE